MKIATTTSDFGGYCNNDADRIRELHRAGFRYIDLSLYSLSPDSPYMRDGWKGEVAKIKAVADELGMQFVQAHAPGGNFLSPRLTDPAFLEQSVIRSIEVCGALGIPNTVLHLGYAADISKEESFEKNRAFCQRLFPVIEHCGVNLLIENSTKLNMKEKYYPNSAADMLEFLRYAGHPQLHICWDTGHANCEGAQYDEILTLGKELYAIHYNDNHGISDAHTLPYFGTLNHDEVIRALIDVDFQGYFALECGARLITAHSWPYKRRPFDGDTRLLNPPMFLQQQTEALMYACAKYMLSAYDAFEE